MTPRLTAALADHRRRPHQRRVHRARHRLQLSRHPGRARRRHPHRLPGPPERGRRLVHGDGRRVRAVHPDRHRGGSAVDASGDEGRGAGRDRRRRRPGRRVCSAGRCWCPASPATRPAATRPSRPRPGTRSSWPTASSAPSIGETLGYLLTAAWTLLVLAAVGGWIARRWFTVLGAVVRSPHPRWRADPAAAAGCGLRQLHRLHPVECLVDHLRHPHPPTRPVPR